MDTAALLTERLASHSEVIFALLFGSRATGRPRPDSDWDVAVYFDDRLSPVERFARQRELIAELSDLGFIDLVVLNDAPPLLAHRALQGRRIVEHDHGVYVEFFIRTLGASEDERYWREMHHRARLQRLAEGRFGRP
jgi:predicted nucleotidyltransferase